MSAGHSTPSQPETIWRVATQERPLLIALAGQPNVGKSTIFNILTGLNQHVGNWPGKTVERKEGSFVFEETHFDLVDLPGTYSLTANSPEEILAREFILQEHPDIIVAVVDAAVLERSLYLVAELMALSAPVVIALNMVDVARQEGVQVEPEVLQAALGVPVVPMVAAKNVGVRELVQTIAHAAKGKIAFAPKPPQVRADHQAVLREIEKLITGNVPPPYPENWVALKLLEGDREITRVMQERLSPEGWESVHAILRLHEDAMVAVASGRYEWIGRMIRAAVTHPHTGQISLTDRLDRWATHPFWGIVIQAAILGAVFWLTYTLGTPLQEWLESGVGMFAELVGSQLTWAPEWLSGLVVDGIIGGVGSVLTFLPILVIFFAVMGILEDVGYMARAAYVMDGFMHLMGLHGKSFLPLFLGFGCNVPSVFGARVIESRSARLLTILLAPLIPCTARMAVIAFLAPAFFGTAAIVVSWGMILVAMIALALAGVLMSQTLFRGQHAAFIMELPLYHIPNWRTIGMLVWQRSLAFVRKAGTVILLVSVLVWVLATLPNGEIENSFLAMLGLWLEPVGQLMGFDWRLTVALLTSFLAKENAIATLSVLFGTDAEGGLAETLADTLSISTALAFMTVQMLFIPCVATLAAIRQETGSWRWTLFNAALLTGIAITGGIGIYQLARLIGW